MARWSAPSKRVGWIVGTVGGLVVDRVVGEWRWEPHPVAVFGSAMGRLDRLMHRDSRAVGAGYAAAGVGLGAAVGRIVPSAAAAAWVTCAGRMLRTTGAEIGDALASGSNVDSDSNPEAALAQARALLPSLVGRDPSELDASGVAAAVIESLAENTVDAVISPAFWGAVAGPSGAYGYRAANTLDAMVGNRSARYEHFGWASARFDDLCNLAPARLTIVLVCLVRPSKARSIFRIARRDAPKHPSPNAGWAEAAFAAALDIELGGPLHYGNRFEDRPRLGDGPRPAATDIDRAVRLADHVELALLATLVSAAVALSRPFPWRVARSGLRWA